MMNEGLLRVIGDIVASETDPLLLVCFTYFHILLIILFLLKLNTSLSILSPYHIQKVTLMLSSAIADEWGLEKKDRDEVTREIIGNVLRMIMVLLLFISI